MNKQSNINHAMNTIKRVSKNQATNQNKNISNKKSTTSKGITLTNNGVNNSRPLGSTIYSQNKKNLDKMLRDYQTFCKKYFGESTPIGAISEERMNKILEDEDEQKINQNYNYYTDMIQKNTYH